LGHLGLLREIFTFICMNYTTFHYNVSDIYKTQTDHFSDKTYSSNIGQLILMTIKIRKYYQVIFPKIPESGSQYYIVNFD